MVVGLVVFLWDGEGKENIVRYIKEYCYIYKLFYNIFTNY